MILRSFTKHLDDQNWFAVVLDFLVVVVGIFIGLQVSDWNQERKDHQQGVYYISFLHSYLETSSALAAKEIEESDATQRNSMQAAMLLLKKGWEDEDSEQFQRLHTSAYSLWGPRQKPVALRQLVDGGKLDLIKSKDIQKAILDYETVIVEAIEQTKTSYSYSQPITLQITNNIRYGGGGISSSSDELRSNRALVSAFRDKFIWQRIQLDVLKDMQKASEVLEKSLARYLVENS